MTNEVLQILANYCWPGNVRELENTIEHAVAVCSDQLITPEDLPARVVAKTPVKESSSKPPPISLFDDRPSLDELNRRYIQLILAESDGNKSRAAGVLGINRRTLYRYLDPSDHTSVDPEELFDS
jgi:two-component system NtrC family response regulator